MVLTTPILFVITTSQCMKPRLYVKVKTILTNHNRCDKQKETGDDNDTLRPEKYVEKNINVKQLQENLKLKLHLNGYIYYGLTIYLKNKNKKIAFCNQFE